MSVRSAPKSAPSSGTLHGPAITFAQSLASAPIDAHYKRVPLHNNRGTFVFATAKFDEISLEMKKALDSTRANILGKPIGQDSGIIEVKSDDVEFSIMIHIEHGGKKVIIDGNVGGKYVTFKEVKEEKIGNDYLSIVPSVLFKMAGGKEDQSVKIKYMVE